MLKTAGAKLYPNGIGGLYSTLGVSRGLNGYWPCTPGYGNVSSGGTFRDTTGLNQNLSTTTNAGFPQFTNGPGGSILTGIDFGASGSTTAEVIGAASGLIPTLTTVPLSMSCWVRLFSSVTVYCMTIGHQGAGSNVILGYRTDQGNKFVWCVDGSVSYALSNAVPVPGVWYHLVGVWNPTGTLSTFWVNGQLQTSTNSSTLATNDSTGSVCLGGSASGTGAGGAAVADPRLYNGTLLTPAEINALYLMGVNPISPLPLSLFTGSTFTNPVITSQVYRPSRTLVVAY